MMKPSVADFKTYFFRDFPYGSTLDTVVDKDVEKAICQAELLFNPDFFPSCETGKTGYLLLSAHFLVLNLRASSQGLNGQFNFLQNSKAAGNVSEGFSIPQRMLDNPELAMLTKTNYGAQYLQIVLPQLTGQIFTICGSTRP